MSDNSPFSVADAQPLDPAKFIDPHHTAAGETRASVALTGLDTLWDQHWHIVQSGLQELLY